MKIERYLKNFIYPHKIILESKVYADLPEHFLILKAAWGKIKGKLQDYMSNLPPDKRQKFFDAIWEFSGVEEFFVKTCWGWKPTGRKVKFFQTDRLGQHCFGAMYTSAKHAWPMHNDIPYLPLAQIDLDKACALIGANVGNGFLQLYQSPMIDEIDVDKWYLVRHVPRKEISVELLTDFPTFSDEQKSRISKQYIYPDFDGLFGNSSESVFISGFDVKSLRFFHTLTNGSDEGLFCILEKKFPKIHKELMDEIGEYNIALEIFRKNEGRSHDFDATLFGFHSPVQMLPKELDSPILNFGGFRKSIANWTADDRTDVYGDGNGAIFIKFKKDGTPEYYFFGSR